MMRTTHIGKPLWAQLYLPRDEIRALYGAYVGSSRSRESLKNWNASRGDADSDSLYDLPELRRRSSDLTRNNPLACSAIESNITAVVGGGLRLQANIDREYLRMSDAEADAWESNVEREFELWWESPDSDAARTLTGPEREALAFRAVLERGDCFVLLPSIEGRGPYTTCVQTLEADMCSNPDGAQDTERLAGGIERRTDGSPVTYWFSDAHPGSAVRMGRMKWTPVPAFGAHTGRRNVLHLYDTRRPGQTRGVPYLAPVIDAIKGIGTYTDTEVRNAITSGLFNLALETDTGGTLDFSPQREVGATSSDPLKLQSGGILGLAPGEKAVPIQPSHPTGNFDPFVMAMTRWVGAALQIPFEILVKHFTASFSASQAAMLEAWRYFHGRRRWIAARYKRPIYEIWLTEAVLLGRIRAPGFIGGDAAVRHAYLGANWLGAPKGMINEKDQTDAVEKRLQLAITSVSEEAAAITGEDWEARLPRILRERKLLKSAGFADPGTTTAGGAAGA